MKPSVFHRFAGVIFVAGAVVLAAGPALADSKSEMLANTCAGCHGTDGSSHGPATPTIASLSKDYFISSMKDFKSGKRPSTVMDRIAKGYSDEEIEAMATHFQGMPFVRTLQVVDAEKAKGGKELAKKYCSSCHEEEGKVGEGVGVLAGQQLPYMQFALADFLSGKRELEKRQKQKYDLLMQEHGGVEAFQPILHYYAGVK
jgi:cytochrome subunit of sulfide dehydrogenase